MAMIKKIKEINEKLIPETNSTLAGNERNKTPQKK
jgi:hypothetical protein